MSCSVPTFEVTLRCWVVDRDSGAPLLGCTGWSAEVQPPIWCQDDLNELEIHLEYAGRVDYLRHLRMQMSKDQCFIKKTLEGKRFIVRGEVIRWQTPTDHMGARNIVRNTNIDTLSH